MPGRSKKRAEGLLAVCSGARITTVHLESPLGSFAHPPVATIRSIAPDSRREGRVRIRASDGRAWAVAVETLAALPGLREGVPVEESVAQTLDAASQLLMLQDRAIGMLARARRSRLELERRLRRVADAPDQIQHVLDRLSAIGLLDDESVARAEAASRFRRGEGRRKVQQRLAAKGIDRRTAEQVLGEVMEEEAVDEHALCAEAAERRQRALQSHPPEVQRRRLMAYLQRRGFTGETIGRVMRALPRSA